MALHLQFRPKRKTLTFTNHSLSHLFSTSNTDEEPPPTNTTSTSSSESSEQSLSSYFSDVKASLRKQQPTSQSSLYRKPTISSFRASNSPISEPSKVASLEEIRKNLHEFRRGSSVPPPNKTSSSTQPISFQEISRSNVLKSDETMGNADPGPGKGAGNHSFDYIRERLGKIRENAQNTSTNNDGRMSLKAFQKSLNTRPTDPSGTGSPSMVIGGKDNLPETVFGKELREKEWGGIPSSKTGFVNIYSYEVLGQKLRKLRPEAKTADWFSLSELNERLTKLKDIEDEAESTTKGGFFMDLKERLISIKLSEKEKANKEFSQKLDILGHLRRTPSFMLHPPKEHLVEKYFHPDNMSSEEKLKIELAKVRDEFKISESDCGSARVQVAQLTTKIKHLSSVLHKKDKHSRKGLIGMVQRRKKLLKYLRRTDWDSYCFVISKLGLRDNPDFKN